MSFYGEARISASPRDDIPSSCMTDASANRLVYESLLSTIQQEAFQYFWREVNPENGLIADSTKPNSPASIAAVGFALTVYPVAVERGWITRSEAIACTRATLRFFWESPQGRDPDATGYKGFYYHFLDMQTGRRAWQCELSTIDTTLLIAGALTAAAYFDCDDSVEEEIRTLAEELYQRIDWQWALNGGKAVALGWKPESGFIKYRWLGYSEAIILYVLGLASPTHPLPAESYDTWLSTYRWKKIYGYGHVYAGPLFIHQFSHGWIDFRGLQDAYMREKGIDYFENSRRATYVQQEYAIRNPRGFVGYHATCWGITASDGPGNHTLQLNGRERRFWDYRARGVPFGPDDGTLSPWAVIASLPFAPEIVLPTIQFITDLHRRERQSDGFECSFNPTYPATDHSSLGWVSPMHIGLDEGPIVLMIENHRTEIIWRLMKQCPYIVCGLQKAGFTGGWLDSG